MSSSGNINKTRQPTLNVSGKYQSQQPGLLSGDHGTMQNQISHKMMEQEQQFQQMENRSAANFESTHSNIQGVEVITAPSSRHNRIQSAVSKEQALKDTE